METFLKDLKYGIRMLFKSPGFTFVAVSALALGIGANTAIFSVVNATLLRPLPFPNPDELMVVGENNQQVEPNRLTISPANYIDYRDQNKSFQSLALYRITSQTGFNLSGVDVPERVAGASISANMLPTLGVSPALGRNFQPEEEKVGSHRAVILSHQLWQRHFGSDPGIVDKTIQLNGINYRVDGVMPKGFQFPTNDVLTGGQTLQNPVELWVPLALPEKDWQARGSRYLFAVGRLKPGVTPEQAQAEMKVISDRLQTLATQNKDWVGKATPMHSQSVNSIRFVLIVLFGAVGFVLLIACANVANLLLARAAARKVEISIRTALGASRARLIRQLLTESVLLALLGGLLGLLLAVWGINLLTSLIPNKIPSVNEIGLDSRVVLFTLLISFLTAIIFGIAPAVQASKSDLNETLKEGGRSSAGTIGRRTRSLLVISEIALAVVLLIGASLLVKSFLRLENVNPGFDPAKLVAFQVSLPAAKYTDDPPVINFYQQLNERLKALPGVQSVSGTTAIPLEGTSNYTSYLIDGQPPPPPGEFLLAEHIGIFPDYFKTMRVPMLRGREFAPQDDIKGAPVVIVNDAMARLHWPNEDAVGKRIVIDYDNKVPREIVGVVSNVKHFGLDAEAKPEMYVPQYNYPFYASYMVVRADGDQQTLSRAIQREIQGLDKDLPIYNVKTMEQLVSASVAQRRFNMLLMTCFAVIAVILAAVGLYGLISYSVNQRAHEIGVRMALGARQSDILKLILGHGLKLAVAGVVLGVIGAFALTRVISSLLYGVSATDPVTFVGISLLLLAVAVLASFIPARRAMNVQPNVALRYE
jgi:putative ABC transport system permease protein